MPEYYDSLEIRSVEERETAQFAELAGLLDHAKRNASAYAGPLGEVDVAAVRDRAGLATLPITRKSDLSARQSATPPFGGYATASMAEFTKVFCSPGPIFEPESGRSDYWRMARAMFAAGMRRGRAGAQRFLLPFHAGRLDVRVGCASARLSDVCGRNRADRAAGRGDDDPSTSRLRGDAVVPEHHCRQGGRARARHIQPDQGAGGR